MWSLLTTSRLFCSTDTYNIVNQINFEKACRASTKGNHVGNCLRDDGNLSALYNQEATVTPTQDSLPSSEISLESKHNLSEMRKCFYWVPQIVMSLL